MYANIYVIAIITFIYFSGFSQNLWLTKFYKGKLLSFLQKRSFPIKIELGKITILANDYG